MAVRMTGLALAMLASVALLLAQSTTGEEIGPEVNRRRGQFVYQNVTSAPVTVVVEENAILARGLPASLSPQTARKHELADQFELWVKDVAAHPISIRTCSPDLQQALMDRIGRLRTCMDENIDRLRAAAVNGRPA